MFTPRSYSVLQNHTNYHKSKSETKTITKSKKWKKKALKDSNGSTLVRELQNLPCEEHLWSDLNGEIEREKKRRQSRFSL